MSWAKWVLVAWLAIEACAYPLVVGRARKPITGRMALAQVAFCALCAWLVVIA